MKIHRLFLVVFVLVCLHSARADFTNGLVAYYPLNGNANDASGNGINGTVNGATLAADRFGMTNSAYFFAGTVTPESNIKIFTTNLNLLPDFSVCAWVNFSGGTDNPRIFSTPGYELDMVGAASTRVFEFNDSSDANVYGVDSTSSYLQGTWHQVVGVRTTNFMSIYVDGQLQSTVPAVDFPTYSRPYPWDPEIGGNSGSLLDAFGGRIDDLHFFSRALSSLEVTNLYNLERTDSDHDGLSDFEEIYLYHTDPNNADTDGDGLSDGKETAIYHTDPSNPDTDGDGFNDGAEVASGHNPLDKNDTPGALLSVFTAIELEFPTQLGKTYQLQASPNLTTWTNFDSQILGDGNFWNKTYSIRSSPRLYYRVELVP